MFCNIKVRIMVRGMIFKVHLHDVKLRFTEKGTKFEKNLPLVLTFKVKTL